MSKKNTNYNKIALAPVGHFRPTRAKMKEFNYGIIRMIKLKPKLYRILIWNPESISVSILRFLEPQKETEIMNLIKNISDKIYESYALEYEDGTKVSKKDAIAEAQLTFDYMTDELIKRGAYKIPTKKELENLPTLDENFDLAEIA